MPCTCDACRQPRRMPRGNMRRLHPGVLPPPYGNGLGHGDWGSSIQVPFVTDLVTVDIIDDDGTVVRTEPLPCTPEQITQIFADYLETQE
jgi:hypothetical protein